MIVVRCSVGWWDHVANLQFPIFCLGKKPKDLWPINWHDLSLKDKKNEPILLNNNLIKLNY